MIHMPANIRGIEHREARVRGTLLTSIMAATEQMVIKSGIRVVTQLSSTSRRELMSPIMRERIFPVGRLSKKVKSRVWMWA